MDRVSSAEPSELTPGSTRSYMSHQEALCLETETASPPAAAHRACWQLRWGQTPHTTPNNPSAPSGAPACPTEPMVCQGQKALQPARPGPARLGSLRGAEILGQEPVCLVDPGLPVFRTASCTWVSHPSPVQAGQSLSCSRLTPTTPLHVLPDGALGNRKS
ncbi:uncharacterized protein LOC112578677 [Bubalus bubalis]|uniref:uncharacterized protein LOC112578677 n=1 Tax=Bubalus bubalis TaxID=89462 RepID=UPI001E1B929E|nr:uncharacterized protein LOC112578677 [Bubalus bubalis]